MSKGSEWGKRFLRQVRSLGRCTCGTTRGLEFAHIKPTALSQSSGRGLNRRAKDIRDHPDAYVFKCHACHLNLDGKNQYTVRNAFSKKKPYVEEEYEGEVE